VPRYFHVTRPPQFLRLQSIHRALTSIDSPILLLQLRSTSYYYLIHASNITQYCEPVFATARAIGLSSRLRFHSAASLAPFSTTPGQGSILARRHQYQPASTCRRKTKHKHKHPPHPPTSRLRCSSAPAPAPAATAHTCSNSVAPLSPCDLHWLLVSYPHRTSPGVAGLSLNIVAPIRTARSGR